MSGLTATRHARGHRLSIGNRERRPDPALLEKLRNEVQTMIDSPDTKWVQLSLAEILNMAYELGGMVGIDEESLDRKRFSLKQKR